MNKQLLNAIRKLFVNTLATTALSVILMCLAGIFQGFTLWGITVPFEMLLVNFLMHVGFIFIEKIEFSYKIINYSITLVYLIGLIIGFGFLFNWFQENAIWVICIVGISVFMLAFVIDIIKINRDAADINEKLKKLRERDKDIKEEKK